jgi:glycerophosphoryl diester phosphodiesterase
MRAVLAVVAALLVCASSAAAVPNGKIHAHRGGPYVNGVPTYAENTLPAFGAAADAGYVLELDVKLTSDKVPLVIHDATFDRTTNCTGPIKSKTAAAVAADCRADVLGVPGTLPSVPVASPTVTVPTLAEVLALAVAKGATVNVEIKNLPTDNDYDVTSTYANIVMNQLIASGIDRSKVIVQSFWPPNLEVAKQRWPGVATSYLTQKELNLLATPIAAVFGYTWVSPAFPNQRVEYVLAHALARKIVPYTLDSPGAVQTALYYGADAVITNDPPMATTAAAAIP